MYYADIAAYLRDVGFIPQKRTSRAVSGASAFGPIADIAGLRGAHRVAGAALLYSCTTVEDYNGRAVKAGYSMSGGTRGSTLLVRVEDVVLRLHGHVARVSAI
jgi:hypothetical protein